MSGAVPTEHGSGGLAHHLEPSLRVGLGTLSRVAGALVGPGGLVELAQAALTEMRGALDLEAAALYLPTGRSALELERCVACPEDGPLRVADALVFDEEAWGLAVRGGGPLVFHDAGSWLVANPFTPAASFWLVLPLRSAGEVMGVVAAAAGAPFRLDPAQATLLALLGDLLSAGVATARLRQTAQRAELERERLRLAADVHDTLAQDLALAKREVALLEADPPPAVARASRDRLRQAVVSAHRTVRSQLEDLAVVVPVGGLGAAVEALAERHRTPDLAVATRLAPALADVAPETAAVVLRVLAEALSNIARHAGARHAVVTLAVVGERLVLMVDDDGRGMAERAAATPLDGHFGVEIMRRRARSLGGAMSMTASPEGGTRVRLEVPVG
jgi:signal transduction histidine kinase